MAKKDKIYRPGVRKRKAYSTAILVFLSYYWLYLRKKLFGKAYYDKRIKKLHNKNAAKVKNRLQELQGLFIKFGQLISNLSNVLPKEFRAPLAALQDHNEDRPYKEIEATILKELQKPVHQLFSNFEKKPIAAASIGQVHKAEVEGKSVVVKIQHHNIDSIAGADLKILKNLVRLTALFMDMQGLDHSYEQVRQMIEEELDYTKEAESMQLIAKNLESTPELKVKVPGIFPDYCTSKVLVAEFCEGVNLGQIETIQSWGLQTEDLAKRLLELYCKMILLDGFYHADPHPGNILVNQQGELILLDFGAVAHLSDNTKEAIPELIEALVRNDTEETVLALRKMGFLGSDRASRKYVEKLIDIFKEFLESEVQLDGLNFQNIKLNSGVSSIASILRKVDLREVSNTIRIPKDYILLNRTVVLLIGDAFLLAPELNTMGVIRPYLQKHILKKDQNFTQLFINTIRKQATTAISLPNELSYFLKRANDNYMEEEIQSLRKVLRKIYLLGQQIFYGLALAALYYLRQVAGEANSQWSTFYVVMMVLFSFLLLRVMVKGFRV